MTKKCVAVAMSGGIDSSVAAALLLRRGYHVQGLTMRLWRESGSDQEISDDIADARAVCEQLEIEHEVVALREAFLRQVVDYFVQSYAEGRTPNPCIRCNQLLKFGSLLDHARDRGFDLMATGHYARVRRVGSSYQLLRGLDPTKDQSYFLYTLGQAELRHTLFPLGEWTKKQVRALAREMNLPITERSESQDICFLRDGDYHRFLAERAPQAIETGPIYDTGGRHLGEHKGLPFYTIGQREGLGISAPRPLYVMEWDMDRNALIVGFSEELGRRACIAEEMSYVSGSPLSEGYDVGAKIRYRASLAPAQVWPLPGGRARVVFQSALCDITPGQSVVFYRDECLLGGGLISHVFENGSDVRA